MTQNRKDRQVVWVSGASSGLGLAAAKAFHRAGYTVVSGARSFTGERTGEGEEGFRICLDVSSDESVKGFAEEAVSLFGEPDILICCAGVLVLGPCETYSMQEISRVTDTDYYGQVRMIQAALPFMRRRRKGRILCFSSINGLLGIPCQGAYTAAKHAVEGFCESLAQEVRPFGVEIMLIEPGDHRSGSERYRAHSKGAEREEDYRRIFENSTRTIAHDETNGSDPDRLGDKLVRIMRRKRLPLRKCIASPSQHLAVFLHRVLPGRVFSKIIAGYYHAG